MSAAAMCLPDFIVAGSRKCSTTWLHLCLSEHPQIFVPAETKEIFFFDRHWTRGVQWYGRFFRDCPSNMICGESTPGYFTHLEVPQRIKSTAPKVKLVFLFRNPIARTVSLYHHLRALGMTRLPFDEALEKFPELIEEGLYYKHLMRFERVFGRGALMPMIAENIQAAGGQGLAPLFRFLNVDERFEPPSFFEKTYERRTPRGHLLAKVAIAIVIAMRDMGLHRLADAIKSAGAERLVFKRQADEAPAISAQTMQRLRNAYRDDAARLGDYMGLDLVSLWNLEEDNGGMKGVRA